MRRDELPYPPIKEGVWHAVPEWAGEAGILSSYWMSAYAADMALPAASLRKS